MITASIVTYNTNPELLRTVIDCAVNSCIERIYVIDNSTADTLKAFVGSLSDKIEYIHGQGNVGYGSAHNIAMRLAMAIGAEYHIVLNPDIQFKEGTIESLQEYMDQNPDIGHVMPRIVYPNGELQYVCKMIPTPADLIFKRFLPSSWTSRSMRKFQLKFTDYDHEMNVPYLSGCFMFFRVNVLKDIGLFDERFFMYPEDIDITRRIHEKYRTMYYPAVTVIHAHAAESRTNKKMLKIHIANMIRYFNKWGWIFDSKRTAINKALLKELNYHE
ncbi:glycosyltransferase family 2 protein [uncultured Rikenella sp.]|uniref:glycosyltransferase family 2 protein n=1 Tax=uncultured Rikenella sp. TaxID=368003 RepID=UPI0025F21DA0|nr:glycosyltransferase family 2 protein [uncultured Rikenella sp.]